MRFGGPARPRACPRHTCPANINSGTRPKRGQSHRPCGAEAGFRRENALSDQPGDHRCRALIEHRDLPDPERPDPHRSDDQHCARGAKPDWRSAACHHRHCGLPSRQDSQGPQQAGRGRRPSPADGGHLQPRGAVPGHSARVFRDRFDRAQFRRPVLEPRQRHRQQLRRGGAILPGGERAGDPLRHAGHRARA